MSKVTVTESYLENIGDAIRDKLGTNLGYTPGQMAGAIRSIPTGGITPAGTINITQNGTEDVTEYAEAVVNVPNSYTQADEGKVVQSGALVAQTSETVTQNGTYDTTTKNEVVVNVSGGSPNLQDKTFTQNGTYTADAGYDGFNEVTVNVSGGGVEQFEMYAVDFNTTNNGSSALSGGFSFVPRYPLTVSGVRFYARSSTVDVFLSDSSGNTIASKIGAQVTAGQWNDVKFDSPVNLSEGVTYVVWGSNADATMRYKNSASMSAFLSSIVSRYSTGRSTFPTTQENTTTYGADLILVLYRQSN